ncbi:MAG: hypothetical protein BroJett040_21010 [Oligoflexia bacterium]|nr:MAG: hypothetical protein BroJett040_21010 [Oligoflexia bacterium]
MKAMKYLFITLSLILVFGLQSLAEQSGGKVDLPPDVMSISATPRLIRESPYVEIFFKELPTSYVLSTSSSYNQILNAVVSAMKGKQAVTLYVNKKTRLIVGMPGLITPTAYKMYEDEPEPEKDQKGGEAPSAAGGAPKK